MLVSLGVKCKILLGFRFLQFAFRVAFVTNQFTSFHVLHLLQGWSVLAEWLELIHDINPQAVNLVTIPLTCHTPRDYVFTVIIVQIILGGFRFLQFITCPLNNFLRRIGISLIFHNEQLCFPQVDIFKFFLHQAAFGTALSNGSNKFQQPVYDVIGIATFVDDSNICVVVINFCDGHDDSVMLVPGPLVD